MRSRWLWRKKRQKKTGRFFSLPFFLSCFVLTHCGYCRKKNAGITNNIKAHVVECCNKRTNHEQDYGSNNPLSCWLEMCEREREEEEEEERRRERKGEKERRREKKREEERECQPKRFIRKKTSFLPPLPPLPPLLPLFPSTHNNNNNNNNNNHHHHQHDVPFLKYILLRQESKE